VTFNLDMIITFSMGKTILVLFDIVTGKSRVGHSDRHDHGLPSE
jgi:hypothetical protein